MQPSISKIPSAILPPDWVWAMGLFCLCLSRAIYAQEPPMWQLTDENGLPSMTVYDAFQDSRGYMWFGTEQGICRYDGYKFKVFNHPQARGKAVSYIQEDSKGNIYFQNFVGQLFYIFNENIEIFPIPSEAQKLGFKEYILDNKDNIWLSGVGVIHERCSVYQYLNKQKKWINHQVPLSVIRADPHGRVYGCCKSVIYEYDTYKWNMYPFNNPIPDDTYVPVYAPVILDKMFLISLSQSVLGWQIQKGKHEYRFEKYTDKTLTNFCTDREGNYWLTSFKGVYAFDAQMRPLYRGKILLKDKGVSKVFQDREGNYWITTLRNGVYLMPSAKVLVYNTSNSNISDNSINCLTADNQGNLILGLNNGIAELFNKAKGQVIHQYKNPKVKDVESVAYNPHNNTVLVGCGGTYVFRHNESQHFSTAGGSSPKMFAIYGNNNLLVAESWCSYTINLDDIPGTHTLKPQVYIDKFGATEMSAEDQRQHIIFHRKRTRSVYYDTQTQDMYLGYADGLIIVDKYGNQYPVLDDKQQPIIAKTFVRNAQGELWIGTLGAGIMQIQNRKVVRHFTTRQGLVSNICMAMTADANGLWLATNLGVQFFAPATRFSMHFSKQDGNISREALDLHFHHDTLWIATPKGLVMLPTKSLRKNTTPPPILITGIQVWEQSLPLTDTYQLPHTENNLKIEFQGLGYRSQGSLRYKYRLQGLDSNWIYTESTNNFARFPSLPPGKYEFEVKAINEDGVESNATAIVHLIITPPYWLTWWFWVLLLLGGLMLVYGLFQWQIHTIERRNKVEQALRESQLSALKVQMNPHFIFNALNSIQEFILLNEKRLANEYLGKFADLMRLTLDMSNESRISLADELRMLELYLQLEQVRFEDLEYHIDIAQSVQLAQMYIPAMLIQPYVENALKHGLLHRQPPRKLWLRFRAYPETHTLLCEIEDNGVGRKRSEELQRNRPRRHKSFATSATQKRLELLNYGRKHLIQLQIIDLETPQHQALGTLVKLQIPLS